MNAGAALAPRSSGLRWAEHLVVVGDVADVPRWVHGWWRRNGRDLRAHRVPPAEPGQRPAPAQLLAAVAPLTAEPVLVVPPGSADTGLRQVTAALHALPDDLPVLAAAVDTARHLGGQLVLAHGLPVSFAERNVGLTPAVERGRRLLDAAAARLTAEHPGLGVVTRLVRAHAHELVGEELETGLLVVGGPRQDVPDDLGLVARTALCHALCPVLLVPR